MARTAEHHVLVDFVREHKKVVALGQRGNPAQRVKVQHAAGWIAGGIEHDGPGLGRDVRGENLRIDPVAIRLAAGHKHRARASEHEAGIVGDPGRRGNQDLVAGIETGLRSNEDAFLDADRHEDIVDPRLDRILARQLGGDRLAQFGQAGTHRVDHVSAVFGDGGAARLLDVGRRIEVRRAGCKADHMFPGRAHFLHPVCHRQRDGRRDGGDSG